MNISAIIFDLDGTLLDTNRLGRQAWKQACRELGFEYTDSMYAAVVGKARSESQKITETFLGPNFDYEAALALRMKYAEELYHTQLRIKPGVEKLLQSLEQRKIPRAVASSTGRKEVEQLLELSGLRKYFEHLIGGDEVRRGKPDPESYLRAAELLQVPPEQCVIVEDTNTGVLGGSNAGIRVIAIPDIAELSEQSKQLAWKVLCSMEEVLGLLG